MLPPMLPPPLLPPRLWLTALRCARFVPAVRELLCTQGESPLKDSEWAELKKLVDPDGRGRVKTKMVKNLPCWSIGLPGGGVGGGSGPLGAARGK